LDRNAPVTPPAANLGINWQLHDRTGWGVYGLNLALQLLNRNDFAPVLLQSPGHLPEHPLQRQRLQPLLENYRRLEKLLENTPDFQPAGENLITLHGLGNNFTSLDPPLRSNRNAGVIFFENTRFSNPARTRAQAFPLIITGSHWNEEVLRHCALPGRIETVIQGIDPTIFHPAPKAGLFKNRFVIFSGGKLEYRKGQDIVIAAFRLFRERHPEALLLAAWHNSWPESMREITTRGLVRGVPDGTGDQAANIARWLVANGLPQESFIVIPETPNIYMASIIREADVALFPNRGEGGTNLVAMEALACGVPTILAANTGQLDFADPEICFPLTRQGNVLQTPTIPGVEGWGESEPEEIVGQLEQIFSNSASARRRGAAAARQLRTFSWENQVDKLVSVIRNFFS